MQTQRASGWRRVRRWALRVGLGLALAAPAMFAGGWLALHHVPGWYRPPQLEGEDLRRAQMDATDTFDWISARMVAGQPFEVVLRGESLNEWLAAAPVSWPDMAEAIPPQVRGMALRLREGGLSLGVRYADERWESIVSVDTSLAMSPDGSSLVVRPMGVRVGAVHVPLEWIAAAAAAVGPMDIRELERSGLRSPTGPITKPADFAQGVVFDNAFVWPNGERSFRIDALDIDERTARIRVSPMGR